MKARTKSLYSFNSSQTEWPKVSPTVYYGVTGEIVKAIDPHTEADPMAILVQLLVAVGNIMGRYAYFEVEADKHYPNLFAVIVGETAKGRKGTSWGYCERICETIDPGWRKESIVSGLSSGEGLINEVQNGKRLLVVESEFSSTLKVASREGYILSPILRQAWDSKSLHVLNKNSPLHADNAHISVIGHITQEELQRSLNSTDIANGFANRFLWVCSRRSKLLPEGGNLNWGELDHLVSTLRDALAQSKQLSKVKRAEGARQLWHRIYEDLSEAVPGIAGVITSRAEAQVMRLALVFALLDESSDIREPHLEAALALWRYCSGSVSYIFGNQLGDQDADTILDALRRSDNGLTLTEITNNVFKRNKSAPEIHAALNRLGKNGLAEFEIIKTSGRSEERWFAVTKETKETKEALRITNEEREDPEPANGREPQPIC